MKKPNLLISYNYFPKHRKYNGEMVNLFVNKGYHCPVLGTNPDHPFWKVQEPSSKERFWYSVEGTTDAKSNGNLKIISCPMHAEDYFSIENVIDSFEHFMLYQKKVPIRWKLHSAKRSVPTGTKKLASDMNFSQKNSLLIRRLLRNLMRNCGHKYIKSRVLINPLREKKH